VYTGMAVGFKRIGNMLADIVIIFVALHFILLPYVCRDMPYSKYYQVWQTVKVCVQIP
jgi:multidrug transporter EmrE-like cation transporter